MTDVTRPFDETDHHAFVDGQMALDRRAVFMRALSATPDLKARIDGWRMQNEALMSTFGSVLFESVPVRLMPTNLSQDNRPRASLKTGAQRPEGPAAGRPSAASHIGVAVVAFLTGALVVFAAVEAGVGPHAPIRTTQAPDPQTIGRSLALRAYEAHETYATDINRPVEVAAGDDDRLLSWIQHRLSMPVRIPDLRLEGWSLIGGRVLPGEVGPAAFLVYGNGVERLGLYMARTNGHQSDRYTVYDNGAGLASVAYWVDEPVGYALTTSRDAAWLDRNAASLFVSIRTQTRGNATAE